MNYSQWVSSPERKVGNGLKLIVLGVVACCVPGGQGIGVPAIIGGVAKIGGTVVSEGLKNEKKENG